jgi:hypothetical protein
MKEYKIFIQDSLYKTVYSESIYSILKDISVDIKNNLVPNFDNTKPADIKIIPIS